MKHDILEVQRYPEISFSPKSIEGLSGDAAISDATVTGLFAIHGQQHDISFPVHIERSATDVTANGTFVVPYVAWGMKDPSTFVLRVNKTVDISVHAVGHIRQVRAQ